MTYRYVQGIDYGQRQGTLGISLHMSEGSDSLPEYLARRAGETTAAWRTRVSGVSCTVAILSTGEIVQMLGWDRASGNLNPDDRAAEYGYYGGSHLRAVLGDHWPDPNTWTVSAELAGRRANGPTNAQVAATIKWGLEMKALFPTIRGATGHHDQSPKECPGLTPNMKAIFTGLGGHGIWEVDMGEFTVPFRAPVPFVIDEGGAPSFAATAPHAALGEVSGTVHVDATVAINQLATPHGPFVRIVTGSVGRRLIPVAYGAFVPPVDCSDAVAAEHERTRAQAIAAVEAIA